MIRKLLPALIFLTVLAGGAGAAAPPAYDDCVRGGWPAFDDAETRAAACSKALQSRELQPDEIALARLTRGVARLAMGEKILAADDYIEALKHYDSVIDWSRPDALAVYRHAVSLEGLGEIDRALKDYGEAIKLDPQSWLAFLSRGVLLATRQRAYERAIEDFDKVLAIDGGNVNALVARGSARSELNQHGPALADLDRAISLAPGYVQAYLMRGIAQSRRGENDLALRDYNLILQSVPDHPMALANRAAIYITQDKLDSAIKDLDAALAINADNAPALFNRAYAYFLKGDFARAIADDNLAIALNPRLGSAYGTRCLARAAAGKDVLRALDDCDTALKLMPLSLDVRETRGTAFLKFGDPQLALHEYDIALELDANRPIALYGRGLARIAIGQPTEGEADRAAAIALNRGVARDFSRMGIN